MACGADEEEATAVPESETAPVEEPEEEAAPVEEPAADKTSIVISVPEDPAGFNAYVGGGDYKRLILELVMLGLTDIQEPLGSDVSYLKSKNPCMVTIALVPFADHWGELKGQPVRLARVGQFYGRARVY